MFLVFLLFSDFTPYAITKKLAFSSLQAGVSWAIFLALTIWLAFLLYSIVDWTVKLFEGYYIPKIIVKTFKLKEALSQKNQES